MDDSSHTPTTDHNIWPSVTAQDPLALRAWLGALGFREGVLIPGETPEVVHHSEMIWPEGGRVMVSSRAREGGTGLATPGTVGVYVVTDEPDAVFARAQRLGAVVERALVDETDYVSRGFSLRDADGNSWSFGTYAG